MKEILLRSLIPLLSLGLIAWGAAWIYPPAAPISVGILLWIDLSLGDRGHERDPEHIRKPRS